MLSIIGGTFRYKGLDNPVLEDITVHIKHSSLTFVIGPSGCGKTTLLEALLGEIPCDSGSIHIQSSFNPHGDVAYCAQRAWLRNDTVQSNILCGLQFDKNWYETVVYSCALEDDIEMLHMANVGHGGSALSGGQKQRIVRSTLPSHHQFSMPTDRSIKALARAVYSRRKLALLDEVLSGLDRVSEQKIVDRLLGSRGLFKELGTTVVLATHSGTLTFPSDLTALC